MIYTFFVVSHENDIFQKKMSINYKKALGFIPDLAGRAALFEWIGEFGESPLKEAEKSWPLAKYESGRHFGC